MKTNVSIILLFIIISISCERNNKEITNESKDLMENIPVQISENEIIQENNEEFNFMEYYNEYRKYSETDYVFSDNRRAAYSSRKTMYVVNFEGLADKLRKRKIITIK